MRGDLCWACGREIGATMGPDGWPIVAGWLSPRRNPTGVSWSAWPRPSNPNWPYVAMHLSCMDIDDCREALDAERKELKARAWSYREPTSFSMIGERIQERLFVRRRGMSCRSRSSTIGSRSSRSTSRS